MNFCQKRKKKILFILEDNFLSVCFKFSKFFLFIQKSIQTEKDHFSFMVMTTNIITVILLSVMSVSFKQYGRLTVTFPTGFGKTGLQDTYKKLKAG